jgi:hypothetical protein
VLLTNIAVRECYQLPPDVFKKNISTLQSTWKENMDSLSMTARKKYQHKKVWLRLRTCDGDASFAVEQRTRQGTYNNGIGIGIVKAEGLLLPFWCQRWQELHEGMRLRQ